MGILEYFTYLLIVILFITAVMMDLSLNPFYLDVGKMGSYESLFEIIKKY